MLGSVCVCIHVHIIFNYQVMVNIFSRYHCLVLKA